MQHVWVMSKSYDAQGDTMPIAWSYGYNYSAMGFKPGGWGLVWLSLDIQQEVFIKSGIDPNVQIVGRENSKPTQLLLDTYKEELGDDTYTTLEQVLGKLGEKDPRFLLERDPHRP
ncbi:MAG: hypothetical protein ACRD72_09015 [Candidatus Angelobacter sp.]